MGRARKLAWWKHYKCQEDREAREAVMIKKGDWKSAAYYGKSYLGRYQSNWKAIHVGQTEDLDQAPMVLQRVEGGALRQLRGLVVYPSAISARGLSSGIGKISHHRGSKYG